MDQNLQGKECGKGICPRKDGLYSVRFADTLEKRHDKDFPALQEARNWLKQATQAPIPKNELFNPTEMTVDTWFKFRTSNMAGDLAPNTRQDSDVKPMYCKMVLNQPDATDACSAIRQPYIAMDTMLRAAVMNDLIPKHPMCTAV